MTSRPAVHAPQVLEAAYYQRLYEIEETHWWSVGMRSIMDALLGPAMSSRRAARILDIGCGTGVLLQYVRERYGATQAPLGLDVSFDALRFCQARGASALVRGTATKLPVRSASIDVAICIDTIQHLSPASADRLLLTEISRALVPGGLLYLRTNSARGRRALAGVDPALYRRYTLPGLRSMIEDAGLTVLRASHVNAVPSLWATMREYLRRPAPPHQHHPQGPGLTIRHLPRPLRWMSPIMLRFLLIEAFFLSRGLDLPFGHSTVVVARKPS